ncbi:MAG: NADAR family protein [Paludibacteraceae bacterium]|nr:NADAR family protein [Paludibacteraceae bacterium]
MKNYFKQEGMKESLLRQEIIDPTQQTILTFSAPDSICGDFPSGKLSNYASGFPFKLFDYAWESSALLYLLGKWSDLYKHPEKRDIQEDVLTAKIEYGDIHLKDKYDCFCRPDFVDWQHEWMTFVVWKKCVGNADFRELLLSTGDAMIVEVAENDSVWAAQYNDEGLLQGANAMGKILMLCRDALRTGIEPQFEVDKWINKADVRILNARLLDRHFYDHRKSMCNSIEELKAYCREPRWASQAWEVVGPLNEEPEISEPISILEPMEAYLDDCCWDMTEICDDYWSVELNHAIVNDLQFIADYLHIKYDWDTLRQHISSGGWYALFTGYVVSGYN